MSTSPEDSKLKKLRQQAIALLLWLVTIILGAMTLFALVVLIEALLLWLARIGVIESSVTLAGLISASRWVVGAVGGMSLLTMMIVGMDFALKHAGQPRAWRLFIRIVSVEAVLILLGLPFF